jgi:hypothetical protein
MLISAIHTSIDKGARARGEGGWAGGHRAGPGARPLQQTRPARAAAAGLRRGHAFRPRLARAARPPRCCRAARSAPRQRAPPPPPPLRGPTQSCSGAWLRWAHTPTRQRSWWIGSGRHTPSRRRRWGGLCWGQPGAAGGAAPLGTGLARRWVSLLRKRGAPEASRRRLGPRGPRRDVLARRPSAPRRPPDGDVGAGLCRAAAGGKRWVPEVATGRGGGQPPPLATLWAPLPAGRACCVRQALLEPTARRSADPPTCRALAAPGQASRPRACTRWWARATCPSYRR